MPAVLLRLLCLALAPSLTAAVPPPSVPQWGRFEAVIPTVRPYANPHRDVTLDVTYTRPDGTTVAFWGFHDGPRGWKIRFRPDQLGTWRYAAVYSYGSSGAQGTFRCIGGDRPGPLAVHAANPIWFGRRGGDALLMRGLHVGDRFFARNWDDPARPLLAQETLWSGNSIHMKRNGADYSDADLRKNAYAIHFCGAGLVFADNDGDSSSGFSGQLDLARRRQDRHDIVRQVWDTVAALPWQSTAPRPELVRVEGAATPLCLAEPGRTYLVYLESRATVRIETTATLAGEWINAQDRADRAPVGPVAASTPLTPPARGDDWLLVLRAAAGR